MTREESDQIEELLMVWYYWSRSEPCTAGYPTDSAMFRLADRSDTYVTDDDIRDRLDSWAAETVDVLLDGLPVLQRAAVGVHCANKAARASVHRSNRMTPDEAHAHYQAAKEALLPMLCERNLVKVAA